VKPRLLFVGATGRARAPMAAGLAAALAGENTVIHCAALSPGKIHPLALQIMAERGIMPLAADLWNETSVTNDCSYTFLLCGEANGRFPPTAPLPSKLTDSTHPENHVGGGEPKWLDWSSTDPLRDVGDEAACLSQLRSFRNDLERKIAPWLAGQNLLSAENAPLQRVWRELARYEHPLFDWEAAPVGENVEIRIRFKPPAALRHAYLFQLRPRELENRQFPWLFQKQLYDCLHDYVIELFSRNPQQDEE